MNKLIVAGALCAAVNARLLQERNGSRCEETCELEKCHSSDDCYLRQCKSSCDQSVDCTSWVNYERIWYGDQCTDNNDFASMLQMAEISSEEYQQEDGWNSLVMYCPDGADCVIPDFDVTELFIVSAQDKISSSITNTAKSFFDERQDTKSEIDEFIEESSTIKGARS